MRDTAAFSRNDPARWTKAVAFGCGEAESPTDVVLPTLHSLAGYRLTVLSLADKPPGTT